MTRISLVAKATAFVLMSMFAMNSFAQNEPAKLTAEESQKVKNILSSKTAAENQITKRDSACFQALLANGNQPIVVPVKEKFTVGEDTFLPGDSVTAVVIRTPKGFKVRYYGVRNVTKKVTVAGEDSVKTRVPGEPAMQGKAVARTRRTVTEKDGNKTATYTRTTMDKVSDEYIEKVNAGEEKLFDNVSTDVEGKKINKLFVGANAGGNFAFNGSELHPEFGIELGWETKFMIIAARGVLSWSNFNQTAGEDEVSEDHQVLLNASVIGRYITYRVTLEVALKLLQSVNYQNNLSLYGEVGLGVNQTDGDEAIASSRMIGITAGLGLEGQLTIAKGVALVGRFGGILIPKNYHDSKQDFNLGLNASAGIRFLF